MHSGASHVYTYKHSCAYIHAYAYENLSWSPICMDPKAWVPLGKAMYSNISLWIRFNCPYTFQELYIHFLGSGCCIFSNLARAFAEFTGLCLFCPLCIKWLRYHLLIWSWVYAGWAASGRWGFDYSLYLCCCWLKNFKIHPCVNPVLWEYGTMPRWCNDFGWEI